MMMMTTMTMIMLKVTIMTPTFRIIRTSLILMMAIQAMKTTTVKKRKILMMEVLVWFLKRSKMTAMTTMSLTTIMLVLPSISWSLWTA
jgi:hypothetical protein